MATNTAPRLSMIDNTEAGGDMERFILVGEHIWGYVSRITIDDRVEGFQVVYWGHNLPGAVRTTRVRTWHRVTSLVFADAIWAPKRTEGWDVLDDLDLYAEDTIAAYTAKVQRERSAAEQARVENEQARRDEATQRATLLAAVRDQGAITYHGTLTDAHGAGRILGWCDCDNCLDSLEERLLIKVGTAVIDHVRAMSVTVTA